ncbi:Hypothetical predicted protein [Octopus vulgaris]|uniref:Uncharacterized protein n=1 Tax=Octopus vulgaris TaxID=6645 RepID=A0AA36FFL1_OCTVU|nr:Hypothetical predicted protein [Octopus vulgaris]
MIFVKKIDIHRDNNRSHRELFRQSRTVVVDIAVVDLVADMSSVILCIFSGPFVVDIQMEFVFILLRSQRKYREPFRSTC